MRLEAIFRAFGTCGLFGLAGKMRDMRDMRDSDKSAGKSARKTPESTHANIAISALGAKTTGIFSALAPLAFLPIFALLFGACAKFYIAPKGEVSYSRGVQILHSSLPHSKVQVELAQKMLSSSTIVFYISAQMTGTGAPSPLDSQNQASKSLAPNQLGAQNQASKSLAQSGDEANITPAPDTSGILFSARDVSAKFDGAFLRVFTYEQLLRSEYDFIDILQDFNIPTPTPSINTQNFYNISPLYYAAYPGFMYSAPMYSPFFVESPSSIAFAQEKRGALKVLLINYLRESSLSTSAARGGFVAVAKKGIKHDGTLELIVRVGSDEHRFYFDVKKD
ncbi:hypothetical protein BKN38_08405 [Helicobacter sp. CLO-3]|uniref:hypothetical protein n=1 Tax=unclassified Helicobacter TaxID=2593540 RepID=UPI0008DA6772|nr:MULTISPECIES: hypothetical protein [unclassified Helicobacter]OHU81764.1 hypothetical protein BKN38_08405 [Helicobacter sp. CLO-3]